MWDLETLRFLNEQAVARQRMMMGEPLMDEEAIEPVFPLAILAGKLIVGPPSLARLLDRIANYESLAAFISLIREYLPELESTIMSQMSDADKIRTFTYHFNNRYFPLSETEIELYEDFTLADFTHHLPVNLMGFTYSDYHEVPTMRPGFILIMALIQGPYDDNNARIPILEEAGNLAGEKLILQIPEGGIAPGLVCRMLDGTKYEAVNAVVDWVHSDTGCWQLDASYEDYGYEEWSPYVVDNLTQQWPRVNEYHDTMTKAYEWLEENPGKHFRELLSFILESEIKVEGIEEIPKEQMRLPLDENAQVVL